MSHVMPKQIVNAGLQMVALRAFAPIEKVQQPKINPSVAVVFHRT
jgi:hypothetical protein